MSILQTRPPIGPNPAKDVASNMSGLHVVGDGVEGVLMLGASGREEFHSKSMSWTVACTSV